MTDVSRGSLALPEVLHPFMQLAPWVRLRMWVSRALFSHATTRGSLMESRGLWSARCGIMRRAPLLLGRANDPLFHGYSLATPVALHPAEQPLAAPPSFPLPRPPTP